ncbi:MAG TPA: SLBB domain-containing protein [bacterium]|nr:SLBB domain-containing protein [bacterium]
MLSPCRASVRRALAAVLLLAPAFWQPASAQTRDDGGYHLGQDKRLQIQVAILGEVKRPGDYLVSDDTDVLELLAKAGGPTEFANLGGVSVKRRSAAMSGDIAVDPAGGVIKVDLDEFLSDDDAPDPPILRPGDVVTVPRNRMHSWRTAFTMVRDVSVVVSTYLLYRRVVD